MVENIRVVLAVVSAVVGALLLITYIASSKRRTAGGLMGALFLAVAIILWLRGTDPVTPEVTDATPSPAETTEEPPDSLGSSLTGSRTGHVAERSQPDGILSESGQPSDGTGRSSAGRTPESTVRKLKTRPGPAARRLTPREPVTRAAPALPPTVEDRIFAAIEASFQWIEEFFDTYAAEVASDKLVRPKAAPAKQIVQIDFPPVSFTDGSADLTQQSQADLKSLATQLRTKYPHGTLEIQAYVDSVGPEAFNYVLTQARADAVRDLLISEGIDEQRLIARGYGTNHGDDELAAARIEFVIRQ